MLSCIKHACFHVFSPFSAYFLPHYIVVEKGLFCVHVYLMETQFGISTTAHYLKNSETPLKCYLSSESKAVVGTTFISLILQWVDNPHNTL